jgi:DNA-binding response OmpR family regulator
MSLEQCDPAVREEETAQMTKKAGRTRRGRILVVEDNADSRDLLSKLLAMSGYEVISASDGETGYAVALEQIPDLIITDINMPRMDGLELLKKVRVERALSGTTVLVVTAFGGEAARVAMEAGADGATAKPFDFDCFIATVNTLIHARQRSSSGRQAAKLR